MEKAVFDDYVKNRYNTQLDYYSKTSVKNQRRYKLFQWTLIVLSALTPVLAALSGKTWSHDGGVHEFSAQFIQVLLVIVSSVVAILTTGLKTFQYQELWVTYRNTYEQLKPEIHYYLFSIGPYGVKGVDKESLFVSRVEAILGMEHSQWPPAKKNLDENNTIVPNKQENLTEKSE